MSTSRKLHLPMFTMYHLALCPICLVFSIEHRLEHDIDVPQRTCLAGQSATDSALTHLVLDQNICCEYSLELSHRDHSNAYQQHIL